MLRYALCSVVLGLCLGLTAYAEKEKEKGKDRQGQAETKGHADGKEKKAKKQKHENGKNLLGDKIKKNGKHEFHKNGKHTASVNVKDGKIAGVEVTHSEKGKVPVKKYKTNKKMAEAANIIPDKANISRL